MDTPAHRLPILDTENSPVLEKQWFSALYPRSQGHSFPLGSPSGNRKCVLLTIGWNPVPNGLGSIAK